MAFKLVVFDFDGTLAASLPWLLGVFDEVAERFGFRKLDRNEVDFHDFVASIVDITYFKD